MALAFRSAARLSSVKSSAAAGVNGTSPAVAATPVAAAPAKPAAAPAAAAAAAAATPKQFTNTIKFSVPPHVQRRFLDTWQQRREAMQQRDGFLDLEISQDGDTITVSSSWASIPEWEAWSLSPECRRSHLPNGIFQWTPPKQAFVEDFVPIVDYDTPVNAKY